MYRGIHLKDTLKKFAAVDSFCAICAELKAEDLHLIGLIEFHGARGGGRKRKIKLIECLGDARGAGYLHEGGKESARRKERKN